uniref:C-type lectin domain-containing protein n=1 Tax=Magallana gigas TaxID=29159 RepID=A0A8W8J7T5_MAGGI
KCYVLEEIMDDGTHGYRVGCLQEQPLIHTTTPTTTTTTTTHAPITKPTTTKTTTHAHTHHHTVPPTTAFKDGCSYISGHHCPLGFDLVNGKCVALTNRPMTYVEAQHYCRSHCSRLMDNISDRDISHLNTYVQYALYDVNVVHLVRLGAHATRHGHFVWDSTNTEIRDITHSNIGNCVVLTPEAHHHHTQLQDDSCNVRRYSICQAVKH